MITEDVLGRKIQSSLTIKKKKKSHKNQKEKYKALSWHAKEHSSSVAGLLPDLRDVQDSSLS